MIRTVEVLGENGFFSFAFYTMAVNVLAAVSVSFVIPFAVERIRRRRFILPKWVAVMHYLSSASMAIMMVFILAFMSWASPDDAFGGNNLIMHVICPTLILISFFQVENGITYSWKDCILGCVPFFVYVAIYFVEVALIGEGNGGWSDLYRIQDYVSPALAIPALLVLGLLVSSLVALVSNYLTRRRRASMFQNWTEDEDPVEVLIEAYGLGSMMGQVGDENDIIIPLDILDHLARKYHLVTDDLMRPYIRGFLNGRSERDHKSRTRRSQGMKSSLPPTGI